MYGKKTIVRRQRIDRIRIRLDDKITRDSRGYARIWGKVVHANALLTYGLADGHDSDDHVEFVPESTVNDPEAIASLLDDPARARALGASAREFVRIKHRVSVHVAKVIDAYEWMTAGDAMRIGGAGR